MNADDPATAPRSPAPDPATLSDIRRSADRLARHEDALARQLHEEMAQLVPRSALPPAFDMEAFCHRLTRILIWAVFTDQPGYVVVDVLRQAGSQHRLDGFPDDEYDSVAHALVQSVRYLTDDWSTSEGSAWITYFLWARLHLLDGASATTPPRPPQTAKATPPPTPTSSQAAMLDEDDRTPVAWS